MTEIFGANSVLGTAAICNNRPACLRYGLASVRALAIAMMAVSGNPVFANTDVQATAEQASSIDEGRGGSAEAPPANSGEIVVTAQRRSERLIDVPLSVSTISGGELANSSISATSQLAQVTPGLVTPQTGANFTPAIRGVTSTASSTGDEANVAVYVDDVYLGFGAAALFDFKDVDRIEVLKGPQGTLFGRNSTGGAIRIVTLSPDFRTHLNASIDYGVINNRLKGGLYATTPLTDKLAASLALNFVDDQGYIKGLGAFSGRTFGATHSFGGRGKILFQPSDRASLTFAIDGSRSRDSVVGAAVIQPNSLYGADPAIIYPKPFEYGGSTEPVNKGHGIGLSLTADIELSDTFSLKSITSQRWNSDYYQSDSDRVNVSKGALGIQLEHRHFSQELILSTPTDHTWGFIGGLYFYQARNWNPFFRSYATDAPNGAISVQWYDNVNTTSYAGFGELTFNPTQSLHLTAGGRYTIEKKDAEFRYVIYPAALPPANFKNNKWNSPTWRAVVRYDLDDDKNVYLSASTGFKSGVYNAYTYSLSVVDPEKITAFELGFKGKVAGFTATLAGFAYNYRDIQIQGQSLQNGVFVVSLANAASARIRGVEAVLDGRLGRDFRINLGGSWMPESKYSSYANAQVYVPAAYGSVSVVPFDATGSRTIKSPKFTGNATLSYNTDLEYGSLRISGNFAYNSGFFFQAGNLSRQGAYGLLNGRIAWTDPSDRYTFEVSGENLTNKAYSFLTWDSAAGTANTYARGREISFGVSAKF